MSYQISERFKSVQGEGVYAGTPMAFLRFVGCSVGKKICNACDTDFEKMHNFRGGGTWPIESLVSYTKGFQHVCLTGGEPFDQDLLPLVDALIAVGHLVHIETSGTTNFEQTFLALTTRRSRLWICVSPKPGYHETCVAAADEVKVIVPGLGVGDGWPTIEDALRWAHDGKTVFLQPRNAKHEIDSENLALCNQLVLENPELRLSVQLHKVLKVR